MGSGSVVAVSVGVGVRVGSEVAGADGVVCEGVGDEAGGWVGPQLRRDDTVMDNETEISMASFLMWSPSRFLRPSP